ncbi:glycosyltransferase family 39 protein [Candidatus Roizmanbacteria bacterium]|nr:glycosyltransferase family 39 protein [Candidatus Roizmanbacteria bacterium]
MKRVDFFFLAVIIVAAFIFRLYKINAPLADFHSWRQADTAAVARNYVRSGIDLLHPTYDDLSSIETGRENPKGYRFVEFPLYNAIVAVFEKSLPVFPVEVWGRIVTAVFSLFIIAVIYYLALKEIGRIAAIFSALTYAIFPFFVFFSRVVLPETTALAFAFISLFFLYLSLETDKKRVRPITYFLSILTFAAALLVKPTVIFYALALFYLFIRLYRLSAVKKTEMYWLFFLSALPLLCWRLYIRSYPEGIPASDWLITSVNTYEGLKNVFLKPAFFRWVFFERLSKDILGGFLAFFLFLGVTARRKKQLLPAILFSALAFLFVFEGGNVQHEYYQTLILPAVALMVGAGTAFVIENSSLFIHPLALYPIITVIYASSFFFSFYQVKDFYSYPKELPQIGRLINTLTVPTDRIVTDRLGDTTLLYLADRKGAPGFYKNVPELRQLGYTHLVTLHPETADSLIKQYKLPVVFQNNELSLLRL